MHLLATTSASLEDLAEPVDLGQTPAALVALSFTDSDLAALAAAWKAEAGTVPDMRLASLSDLRHPMSVDLWIDKVARHARVILVRILGGYDWWRYGCDRLAAVAREHGIALALLPGECRERDERLAALSTLPGPEIDALLSYFREGGPENMRTLVQRMARLAGADVMVAEAKPLPKVGFYDPYTGAISDEFAQGPLTVTSASIAEQTKEIVRQDGAAILTEAPPLPHKIVGERNRGGKVRPFIGEVGARVGEDGTSLPAAVPLPHDHGGEVASPSVSRLAACGRRKRLGPRYWRGRR
jgi:cobaltochelatase CobN